LLHITTKRYFVYRKIMNFQSKQKQNWHSTPSGSWLTFSGLPDKFCFFYKVGLSDQYPQPLLHEEKPWLILDSTPGPLGSKSAMLPTEPWRSSFFKALAEILNRSLFIYLYIFWTYKQSVFCVQIHPNAYSFHNVRFFASFGLVSH
jgi:hypothetical protein